MNIIFEAVSRGCRALGAVNYVELSDYHSRYISIAARLGLKSVNESMGSVSYPSLKFAELVSSISHGGKMGYRLIEEERCQESGEATTIRKAVSNASRIRTSPRPERG